MKISKIFVGIIAMMICLATSFSSCKKDVNPQTSDDGLEYSEMSQNNSDGNSEYSNFDSIAPTNTRAWYSVSNSIKNNYYSAYYAACNNSYTNVLNNPVHVGFYTGLKATYYYLTVYYSTTLNTLYDLYYDNQGYTYYKGYSNTTTDFNDFKNHITYFVTNKSKPVVVLASTQNLTTDILIVWAVSSTGVRVTRISDTPATLFGDNYIIELSWSSFFNKAISASNYGIANVAYMGPSIY